MNASASVTSIVRGLFLLCSKKTTMNLLRLSCDMPFQSIDLRRKESILHTFFFLSIAAVGVVFVAAVVVVVVVIIDGRRRSLLLIRIRHLSPFFDVDVDFDFLLLYSLESTNVPERLRSRSQLTKSKEEEGMNELK